MNIRVDNTTERLIDAWREHQAKKPDAPEDYLCNVEHLRIRMDEWERQDNGYRAIIGARLSALAMETL